MKFKDADHVIQKIKDNLQVPSWITKARKEHRTLKALLYGEGFEKELLTVEHIESEKRAAPRKKYSRPIKAHVSRLLTLIDNVYSATGGNKTIKDVITDKQKAQLLEKITNARDNKSLEKFLQTYWAKDLYVVDPCGILYTEYLEDDWRKLKPTYKSIDVIRNYYSDGQTLEWLIFEPTSVEKKNGKLMPLPIGTTSDTQIFRVVDDAREYHILKDGETYTELDTSFNHPFGIVPGVTCSDKQILGRPNKLSFIEPIKEDLLETLRDQSVLTIYKFQNGFPIPYRPRVICPECKGTKKNGEEICKKCDGTGLLLSKDVTDEIILPVSFDGEVAQLPSNFAGYISPPLDIWNQYNNEQDLQEDRQMRTLWGGSNKREGNDTATGRYIDTQPITNTLTTFSGVAEFMEHFFIEMFAKAMFKTQKKVSIVMYGKRFIIEPIDVLLKRYSESKSSELPSTILDEQIVEYLTGKYKNDIVTLGQELNKLRAEPYPHYTIQQVKDVFGVIEAQKKMLYSEWWNNLADQEKNKSPEALKIMYELYFKELELIKKALTPKVEEVE